MTLQLKLTRQPIVPLEAEVLSPSRLAGMTHADVCALPIYHGKRQSRVDDFFEVTGDGSDEVHMSGNLEKVRWLGRAMEGGKLTVDGNVGMHLGAYMKRGQIEVKGDAGDWVGAEMKNGSIHVHGNAGGQIGGGYRGSMSGMKNGLIRVDGTAGLEVGLRMRRGTIALGGVARDFVGLQMKGGTIVLREGAEIRAGAWMNRGTIISLKPLQMMPTFRASGPIHTPFLSILAKELEPAGIEIPHCASEGYYERFTGDNAVPGQGEILIWHAVPSEQSA